MTFKFMVKHKIIGLTMMVALLLVLAMTTIVLVQKERIDATITPVLDQVGRNQLAQITNDVFHLLEATNELIQDQINHNLEVARYVMNQDGNLHISEEMAAWEAVNQYTGAAQLIDLPQMNVGEQWLGQNRDMNANTISCIGTMTPILALAPAPIRGQKANAGQT